MKPKCILPMVTSEIITLADSNLFHVILYKAADMAEAEHQQISCYILYALRSTSIPFMAYVDSQKPSVSQENRTYSILQNLEKIEESEKDYTQIFIFDNSKLSQKYSKIVFRQRNFTKEGIESFISEFEKQRQGKDEALDL